MKSFKVLIFSFIVLSVLVSCRKDKPDYIPSVGLDTLMPRYTDTGANVVAFKINGRKVIAEDKLNNTRSITLINFKHIDSPYAVFYLEAAFQSEPRYEGVIISIRNFSDTGIYYLNKQLEYYSNGAQYLVGKSNFPFLSFNTTEQFTGKVHIRKIDKVKKVLSGTFEFEAENIPEGFGKVAITEGVFDAIYSP